jgi:hypothetical protein
MDIHKNARLSFRGRELLVQLVVVEGLTPGIKRRSSELR